MTKERLRRYQAIKRESDQIKDKIAEVEAALYAPKIPKMSGMPATPSSRQGSALEALAIHHIELQGLYRTRLAELATEQLEIEKAIESLEPTERSLMRFRYIDGLTWEEVCVRINYGWVQTHRIHGRALAKLRSPEEVEENG